MGDQVVKKAIEKRDEAIREVERWENWIKAYEELIEPLEPLDVLMPRTTSAKATPADDLDIALALRRPDLPAEGHPGRGSWLRNGNGK
jgi:hypothetical protein